MGSKTPSLSDNLDGLLCLTGEFNPTSEHGQQQYLDNAGKFTLKIYLNQDLER